jgi:hypothetical protein
MVLKISKTHLNYRNMKILGHILSPDGRTVDPGLVKDIHNLQAPKTLQSLLGLIQAVAREYIPNLSSIIIGPIQELTKKKKNALDKVNWDDEIHGKVFDQIKYLLTHAPVLLLLPDNNKKFFRVHVETARKGRGIGAVLLQERLSGSGHWQPVAYYSRALKYAERNYSATELECTGLHDLILHWAYYLQNGAKFDCIVDRYALVYMVTKKEEEGDDGHGRLARLCIDLQDFSFYVIHRQGKCHLDADAVSRLLQKDEVAPVCSDDERDDRCRTIIRSRGFPNSTEVSER